MCCRIYIDELQKPALAEAYCDRVYAKAVAAQRQPTTGSGELPIGAAAAKPPGSIYLQLVQVRHMVIWTGFTCSGASGASKGKVGSRCLVTTVRRMLALLQPAEPTQTHTRQS